jgi:hypothetical protein
MIAKFALLILVSFGFGMVIPLPDSALATKAKDELVTSTPQPSFTIETITVDGDTVVMYKSADEGRLDVISTKASKSSDNKDAELADLQDRNVI